MPGIFVRRDHSANNRLPDGRDTTYMHLAAHTYEWSWMEEDTIKEIERFVTGGGRLAISFFPETSKPFRWLSDDEDEDAPKKSSDSKNEKKPGKRSGKKKMSKKTREMMRRMSLKERWGLDFTFLASDEGSRQAMNESALSLPESLAWHGNIVFTNLPSSWSVIYARGGHPVVIERKFGTGSVVIATDSYFLSNEALLKDRHPDLLSWWIGPNKRIIFDEAHLGVVDNPGVAALIRKYHLHGLVLGSVLLAGLFIWKNSVSFVPAHSEEAKTGFAEGKDSGAGFVNLLRRNIAASQIVNLCFAEWKKSVSHGNKQLEEKGAKIQTMLDEENARSALNRNPVSLYRDICAVLKTTR